MRHHWPQFSNAEVVGVDKIRDLLFGNQMQDSFFIPNRMFSAGYVKPCAIGGVERQSCQ
jgi:hypothetical protein